MIHKRILLTSLFAISCLSALAEPFTLVSPGGKSRILVPKDEPEYVLLAAEDLASDVNKITGVELKIVRGSRPKAGDVFIKTNADESKWESYDVSVAKGVLTITGTDERGTMFGIYDFIENYLGVDPLSWWNDTPYPAKDRLSWEDVSIHQDSPTFKFRGWFINDEDLLTAFKPSGGDRRIDYPFYSTVVNPALMEKVAEALVRSRYNLIIPASFIDIANPAEAALVDVCARRGVFLSMHHVEPMGVSGFTYLNYWKDRGQDVKYSYFSEKDKMIEVWREYAKLWSKYPNVIWQVGLRGIADKPSWTADPDFPKTEEGRGRLISEAIASQIGILDEIGVPKEGRHVSTTLWMEGAALNDKGYLKFPDGAIIVFADNGPGWKWPVDFWSVDRKPYNKYGVYYHHALITDGPHLASLTPVYKTFQMLKDAEKMSSSEYAIFNVSNIREFTYDIASTSSMCWNLDKFSPEAWTEGWIARHYTASQKEWEKAYKLYYNALQLHPSAKIPMFLDGYMNEIDRSELKSLEKEFSGEKVPGALDEQFEFTISEKPQDNDFVQQEYFLFKGEKFQNITRHAFLSSEAQRYASLCAQKASYELTMNLAKSLYDELPEAEKPFALTTILYPSTLMYHFTAFSADIILARETLDAGRREEAIGVLRRAVQEMDSLKEAEGKYCSGKWEGWYNDCRKVDLNALCEKAESILNKYE